MYKMDVAVAARTDARLPNPAGYRILIALAAVEEKTDGGVILTDELRALETTAAILGFVLKMGPDCYQSKDRFPNGPWCNLDDWVQFPPYSGHTFRLGEAVFRLINDDTILGVVADPRGLKRR